MTKTVDIPCKRAHDRGSDQSRLMRNQSRDKLQGGKDRPTPIPELARACKHKLVLCRGLFLGLVSENSPCIQAKARPATLILSCDRPLGSRRTAWLPEPAAARNKVDENELDWVRPCPAESERASSKGKRAEIFGLQ
jgi:hypothetical protein